MATTGWQKGKRTLSGTIQRAWMRRDVAVYPRTTEGTASFFQAVNSGSVSITLTDPTTTPTGVFARFSLSNNLLYVEAGGSITQLQFERTDGAPMSGVIPGGGGLTSGAFYNPTVNTNSPYDKQWKVTFTPVIAGQSLKLTFKLASGTTFVYTFIVPSTGSASNVLLFGKPTVTAPTPTPTTGLTFEIVSYDCITGVLQFRFASPSSAIVSATIPGVYGGTSAPNTILTNTFPGDARGNTSNNTRLVTGTITQSGVTANVNFTTSCTLAPFSGAPANNSVSPAPPVSPVVYVPANFSWTPLAETDRTDKFPVIESADVSMKIALNRQWFGTTEAGLSGDPWILQDKHDPAYNSGTGIGVSLFKYIGTKEGGGVAGAGDTVKRISTGAGQGTSIYQNPRPFNYNGPNGEGDYSYSHLPEGPALGINSLTGDDGGYTPILYNYGRSGNTYYTKQGTVLYSQIGMSNPNVMYETWRTLTGKVLDVHQKISINNNGTSLIPQQVYFRGTTQEFPFIYMNASDGTKADGDTNGNGRTYYTYYDGDAPYTNASPRSFNMYVGGNGNLRAARQFLTEGWAAVVDSSGRGMGLIMQYPASIMGMQGSGDHHKYYVSNNDMTSYFAQVPNIVFDDQIAHFSNYKLVIGTLAEIRAVAYETQNRLVQHPRFRFNTPDRLNWYYFPAGDEGDLRVSDDGPAAIGTAGYWNLKFYATGQAIFRSPPVAYPASTNTRIYINMAYTGPNTEWQFNWTRNQQLENSTPSTSEEMYRFPDGRENVNQNVRFAVIGDGVTRTYEVNPTTSSEWKKVITGMTFSPNAQSSSVISGAKIYWISSSATMPTGLNSPVEVVAP